MLDTTNLEDQAKARWMRTGEDADLKEWLELQVAGTIYRMLFAGPPPGTVAIRSP